MYLLWLFRLWYCSKCLTVMNCSAVALWYCSTNKSDSLFYWFYTNDYIQKNPKPKYFFHFFQKILLTSHLPHHQCRFTMILAKTPQLVPKNSIFWSTNFRKIPFLGLFLYIFCTKMTQMTQCHTYINTWRNFIKI